MKKLTLLTLIPLSLVTIYALPVSSEILLDRVIATVNNEVITWGELMNNIEMESGNLLKGLSDEEQAVKIKDMQKEFLEGMIDLRLQIQDARKSGLSVSSTEIDGAINDIKRKFNITDEDLAGSLREEGLSMKEYRKRLGDQILLSKVVRYKVNDNIHIGDKEIESYYDAHKDKYQVNEKVRIRQIFFARPEEGSSVTDFEERVLEAIRRANEGVDFAEIAQEFSEDASREYGGDLGFISRGSVIKEIEDVAFGLKTGEISKPFWSSKGLHIVKLEDMTEGVNDEKVRNEIREILFKEAFNVKYDDWLKTLREKAYIETKL
jgi:peptidyl-prolyl cis-trans isomerase SurA